MRRSAARATTSSPRRAPAASRASSPRRRRRTSARACSRARRSTSSSTAPRSTRPTSRRDRRRTTFHEIQNPNDELAVTYLFYELQRTYRISERIHKLTPVILVANDVPAPDEIDDAWLVAHDWILRRVILDDSFRPALEYLTKSFVGAEVNIRILEANAAGPEGAGGRAQPADPGTEPDPDRRRSATSCDAVQELGAERAAAGHAQHRQADLRPDRHHRRRRTPEPSSAAEAMVDYAQRDPSTGPSARSAGCSRSSKSPSTRAADGRRQALRRGQGALRPASQRSTGCACT